MCILHTDKFRFFLANTIIQFNKPLPSQYVTRYRGTIPSQIRRLRLASSVACVNYIVHASTFCHNKVIYDKITVLPYTYKQDMQCNFTPI